MYTRASLAALLTLQIASAQSSKLDSLSDFSRSIRALTQKVSPAVVQTKILDQLTPQQVSYMTDKIPMRRTGKPEEIAAVVHFLASPDCSFVTGQCYDASGGRATY